MHIIIFGDSIAQGFFDTEKGGWATLLSMHLQNLTIESEYNEYFSVFNQSISGENTTEIISRFGNEIQPRISNKNKNVIIFAGGINDAKRLLPSNELYVPADVTRRNVESFISLASRMADKVFLVGLNRVNEQFTTNYNDDSFSNKDIEEYDSVIKDCADRLEVAYIPVSDLINDEHLDDGLHPNAVGHQLIFDRIKNVLEAEDLL